MSFPTGTETLISPGDTWTLWAMILIGVALSIFLEQNYRWAAKLSGPVLALLIAMFFSNLNIMPMSSAAYDVIGDYLVPTAVALLLFRASLIEILRTSRSAFVAMQIAVAATVLGSLIAAFVLSALIPFETQPEALPESIAISPETQPVSHASASTLARELPEVSGMMAASYSGGGVNFFAVKQIYGVDEGLSSSLLVADNFVMAATFLIMFSLAAMPWMRRRFPHPHSVALDNADAREQAKQHWRPKPISLIDIAKALAIAVSIAAFSHHIASAIGQQFKKAESTATGSVQEDGTHADTAADRPLADSSVARLEHLLLQIAGSLIASKFIWVTLLTITVATVFRTHISRIAGTEEIGGYLLYVFLFSIGLPSDFQDVIRNVPLMFLFCAIICVVNLVLTLSVGKLFRMNLEELLLASNASIGGPPTAAAMAVSMGWKNLVTPGLLIGLWGYVVGTAVGVGITELLRQYLTVPS